LGVIPALTQFDPKILSLHAISYFGRLRFLINEQSYEPKEPTLMKLLNLTLSSATTHEPTLQK
jgi:hypothetical protein